jgi:uncharacterized Zn-finger protein
MTTTAPTSGHRTDPSEALITARLRAPDYREWRTQVQATGGCAAPIHLNGSSRILDRDGAVLLERSGTVLAPCGNRRATVCPACSDRYAADAYHLLRAGLAGDDTKQVPASVVEHPRVFLTLTAPSFGPVHTRALTARGHVIPCRCGRRHHADDPGIGTALDPDSYDYQGAVLWQAHAGMLWARFTIALRRVLAAALGVKGAEFPAHARLSYAKVAEYQRRGLVHFHAVIRLDGPDGPTDPCPTGITTDGSHTAYVVDGGNHSVVAVDTQTGTQKSVSSGGYFVTPVGIAVAAGAPTKIVAIGVSTGGPDALAHVLPSLPKDFPVPIVIAQHMPPVFTSMLANRLSLKSRLTVRECVPGDALVPGHAAGLHQGQA